ncbi:MAG: hypothetical protein IIB03_10945, partial [Acidobacteria bacterium]|nr:hypothetical protein [Acidobacteriota bacterium]
YWQGIFNRDSLSTLTIDMNFRNFQKIEAKRQEAIRRGILQALVDDFVPAQLEFEGQSFPAEMRLKGDGSDHWEGEKWSFRIKLDGDHQLLGMRRFSIQDPRTRNNLFEWGYLENLRNEGILAPRYEFVQVVFNGVKLGI